MKRRLKVLQAYKMSFLAILMKEKFWGAFESGEWGTLEIGCVLRPDRGFTRKLNAHLDSWAGWPEKALPTADLDFSRQVGHSR
jgi:hypothetical protein